MRRAAVSGAVPRGPETAKVLRLRWVMFALMALATFFVSFHRTSFGVIRADLSETFGLNATQFSLISSMYFYTYVACQIPVGILADRIGVRKVVGTGCLITAVGTALFAAAPSFPLACLGRALVGMGVSAGVLCSMKLYTQWFKEGEVTTVNGVGNLFGTMGGLVAQTPLAMLVGALTWRVTFGGAAVISLVISLLCFAVMRDSPESMGLPSIAEIEGRPRRAKAESGLRVGETLRRIFSNRHMWLLFFIMPVMFGSVTLFTGTWGVTYVQEVFSLNTVEAAVYTSITAVGMAVSNPVICFLSDRMHSRKKPLVTVVALALVIWLLLGYGDGLIKSTGTLGIVMFLFGCTNGALPILFAIVREVNDPAYVGMSIGVSNTFGMLSSTVFPVICGSIIDANPHLQGALLFRRAFLFVVVLVAAALVCSLLTKETGGRNIYHMEHPAESNTDRP